MTNHDPVADVRDPFAGEERKAVQGPEGEVDRANSPTRKHEDRGSEACGDDDSEHGGRAQPANTWEPGGGDEQQQEQAQNVVGALEDDGRESLRARRPGPSVECEYARRLAGPGGQDVVEEVADQERGYDRACRRTSIACEQVAPAHRLQQDGGGEHRERRQQPPVVTCAQPLPDALEVDMPDR